MSRYRVNKDKTISCHTTKIVQRAKQFGSFSKTTGYFMNRIGICKKQVILSALELYKEYSYNLIFLPKCSLSSL